MGHIEYNLSKMIDKNGLICYTLSCPECHRALVIYDKEDLSCKYCNKSLKDIADLLEQDM